MNWLTGDIHPLLELALFWIAVAAFAFSCILTLAVLSIILT